MERRNFIKNITIGAGICLFPLPDFEEEKLVLKFNIPTQNNRIYKKEFIKKIPEKIYITQEVPSANEAIGLPGSIPIKNIVMVANTVLKDDGIYIKHIKIVNKEKYELLKEFKLITAGFGEVIPGRDYKEVIVTNFELTSLFFNLKIKA